jgi:hypothetical protein
MMLASTIAGKSIVVVCLVPGSIQNTDFSLRSGAATTITTNPIWLIQTHQATRGVVEVRLPHVISSYLISSDAPPPSHSQQDPAQGERKVIKKKPGMLQAAREIIGEKGITVSIEQVVVSEVMCMLNVWNVCTGIMARDRTCLGPRDQSCPTSQYRQDSTRLPTSSPLLTFDLIDIDAGSTPPSSGSSRSINVIRPRRRASRPP